MTRNRLILIAAAGSVAVLLGAFVFQYVFGYAPCALCLWQRWPHALAPLIAVLAFLLGGRLMPMAGAGTMTVSTGLGVYHTGVERAWWPGPASCTSSGGGLGGLSGDELLNLDAASAVVLCDEVAWSLFGLSMASYNALGSAVLAALWVLAAVKSRQGFSAA
ncbi:disulfide bond formation protein DsbB [Rhodovulum iodosum]|uniref:Disulfide bond formation protein DsbB n=1 Tax=Rhodovulum iodosum TaxID=68291 RepID=A0ABV3XX93_9RHOB|nr:disulfide bond formation protein B [Rhodovulum robiginosum]RSK38479.1 disulfide bond formation protein B [Rhodovulum robiginosum]